MFNLLLQNLGLGENETKVYLALLEMGSSMVTEIGSKAGINRTTCYDVLDRLVKYNLVSHASGKQARKKYTAQPPSYLISFLERKQKAHQKQLVEVKNKLPELEMLYNNTDKPSIKFFEGAQGIKAIFTETLDSKEDILSIADADGWDVPDMVKWAKEYNRQRAKLKIHERVLILPTQASIAWIDNYPTTKKYTHFKFLPKGKFLSFNAEVNIFEDKVMIAILKKPHRMGVLISSPYLANILKAVFEVAWESIKP